MNMAVTIQDIADRVGVSRGTVDRALNQRGRIKPEVAKKIQEAAAELGYVVKQRKSRSDLKDMKVGVVTQLANASFMIRVNKGIQDAKEELLERGVELVVRESMAVDEQEQISLIEELEAEQINGLAIMPVESELVRAKINSLVEEKGIPVITFNSDIVGTRRSCFVGLDNRKSGMTAAGLMGMLTRGSGKVLAITGFFSNSVNSMRVDGFVNELKQSYPGLELVGVHSSFDQAEEVEKIILNTMNTFPDLAGILVVSGGQAGIRSAFKQIQPKEKPYVIVYDLTPRNEKALQDDLVDFLIDQDGYVQGYRPPFLLADMLQKGQDSDKEFLFTDINIKTKYNLD